MVLRTRSTQKMKQEGTEQTKPKSAKKPKTAAKKATAKIDSNKPKKPPTAFFFYLYVYTYIYLSIYVVVSV